MISTEVLVDEQLEKNLHPGKKTILYVGLKYDYGRPDWGLSYEHYNFYQTFLSMGYSLIYFDYDRLITKFGYEKETLSKMLLEAAYYYQPDVLFYFNYKDWIEYKVWDEISNNLPTKTIIWLGDDHWRYDETKPTWKLFNLIVTTDKNGYRKRKGKYPVLLSQWACGYQFISEWAQRLNIPKKYDVSFIGRCHNDGRIQFVETLRNNGIDIKTFGEGWQGKNNRRLSQIELIKLYRQSKIVLNISLSSNDKYMIKGRDFEVPGSRSLLLTQDSKEILNYFEDGIEIMTYKAVKDAAEKIKYILGNDRDLKDITKQGYERILKDHTYEKRLREVLHVGMD